MASPNLSEVITTTMKNRRKTLADNVLNHNALLRWLDKRGKTQLEDGGDALYEELEYAENGNFMYYSGYEALNISPTDVFSAAQFDWKQAAVNVVLSGLELRKNSGRQRAINLLEKKIKNAEKTMKNNVSTGIYSDGTGTSSKQIGGLQHLVADSPSSGVVGSIDRSTYTFWQNQTFDASSDGGAAVDATNIQGYMNTAWLEVVRGSDKPDIIVAGTGYFGAFWESMQAYQRITDSREANSGFESLMFRGPGGSAPVFYDDACNTSRMYMLNTDYIFWRVHRDANFDVLARRESVNQDAIVVPLILMGNMTMSNASLQQVIKA